MPCESDHGLYACESGESIEMRKQSPVCLVNLHRESIESGESMSPRAGLFSSSTFPPHVPP